MSTLWYLKKWIEVHDDVVGLIEQEKPVILLTFVFSSVSSSMNSLSAVTWKDLMEPYLPKMSDFRQSLVTKTLCKGVTLFMSAHLKRRSTNLCIFLFQLPCMAAWLLGLLSLLQHSVVMSYRYNSVQLCNVIHWTMHDLASVFALRFPTVLSVEWLVLSLVFSA